MRTCNRCQTQSADQATRCSRCGNALARADGPEPNPARGPALWSTNKTLFGLAGSPDEGEVSPPEAPLPSSYRVQQKTLIGPNPDLEQSPEALSETESKRLDDNPEQCSDTKLGLGPRLRTNGEDKAASAPSELGETQSDLEQFNASVPRSSRWSRHSQGKLVVAAAALFLIVGSAIALLLDPSAAVTVRLLGASDGETRLAFSCRDCGDGTRLTLEGQSTVFEHQQAQLATRRPLALGVNSLPVRVEGLRWSVGRTVNLEVLVPYRVHVDIDSTSDELKLPVRFETLQGATVALGGQSAEATTEAVTLDLDLSKSLDSRLRIPETRLSQRHPFTITHPVHGEIQGVVNLDLPITPLTVTAPVRSIVVTEDRFRMSGTVCAGATLSANGGPIAVDADGGFNQLMGVSNVGEVTLRLLAKKKGHAPRRADIVIKRVKSLRAESATWLQREHSRIDASQSNYDVLMQPSASTDEATKQVSFRGRAQDSKSLPSHALTVFDIPKSCSKAPCLVRVRHAKAEDMGSPKLRRGQWINVFGRMAPGDSDPQGLPTVHAEFIVPE